MRDRWADVFRVEEHIADGYSDFCAFLKQVLPVWEKAFVARLKSKGVRDDEIEIYYRSFKQGVELPFICARGHKWTYHPMKKNATVCLTTCRSVVGESELKSPRDWTRYH
ncbi:hypothetical protein [Lentilitoribacter sp. EG35]|uniref:hypothetical protein n=1 Tax=Lentilitoribacter sp. EG35 TaxID=3234192 RepID=UPI00345FAE01